MSTGSHVTSAWQPLRVIDDLRLRQLAGAQHGLISVEQSESIGFGPMDRHRLSDGRRWERLTPRVLGLVGAPATRAHGVMLAVLDGGPGAALAGHSAAAWWGIPGNLLEPLEVHRVRGHVRRPERAGKRHEPLILPDHHVVRLDGVATVVPARSLFDVAGSQRRGAELEWWVDRMARMVDSAWSLRLVSGGSLQTMLAELAQRGRPGIRVMRQVLRDRGRDYVPPASGLESRFAQILERSFLPPFRRQIDLGDDGRWIGRVDFLAEDAPLVVEVQSERFHTSMLDQQLDSARRDRLDAAGFTVLELTDDEVWHRAQDVVAKVAEALRIAARASLCAHTPRTRRHSSTGTERNVDRFATLGGAVSSGWRRRRSRRPTCPRRRRRWSRPGPWRSTGPRSCRSASPGAAAACW